MPPSCACCARGAALPGTLPRSRGTTPENPVNTQDVIMARAGQLALSELHLVLADTQYCSVIWQDLNRGAGHTSSGLGTLRSPVPSLVYMSSALPAFGKHSTRHLAISQNPCPTVCYNAPRRDCRLCVCSMATWR